MIGFKMVRQSVLATGICGCVAASASFAATGPCDIYKEGATPCVAAHSMVRALYGAYAGNLYQVKRGKDSTTAEIGVLTAGGYANSKTQDDFCSGTTCTVSIIYDQSGKGNHLTAAPGGSANKTPDKRVVATDAPLKVNGFSVYGAKFKGGQGYRNIKTSGVVTGDNPESMYMVVNGKNYNTQCCFDYGNAETTSNDDGEGTMEAIYFGNSTTWGKGAGTGPWIMADIENGLWAGATSPNNNAPSINANYVTGMVKGKPHTFAVKWGDATTGKLNTYWEGAYPEKGAWGGKYDPMRKQGAIILGIGGDNSNWAVGTWYEGVMTTGYATSATDDAVQANIVAAGFGSTTTSLGGGIRVESSVSLHFDARSATTSLSYTLEKPGHVRLRALDLRGREVARLVDGTVAAGSHVATWDARQIHNGMYTLLMETGSGEVWSGKVLVGR
jgi:non-reducing end alpha-L-arabinofuranosidase